MESKSPILFFISISWPSAIIIPAAAQGRQDYKLRKENASMEGFKPSAKWNVTRVTERLLGEPGLKPLEGNSAAQACSTCSTFVSPVTLAMRSPEETTVASPKKIVSHCFFVKWILQYVNAKQKTMLRRTVSNSMFHLYLVSWYY